MYYNYCTLFDSNYLTRGLVMYESLRKHSGKFHLYIFPFDSKSLRLLKKLKLEFVTIISQQEFEDEELLEIKKSRTPQEYCWTCTPSIIKYTIEKFGLESCTYIDADLYFYDNPEVLIEEMDNKSVLITEHRYTPKYNQIATSGIYCVQFITFKNDPNGMKVLNWWQKACNEWCYARCENGKFGDQKYLDDWLTRFEGIHVLQHLGGGVAPWNIQQYDVSDKTFDLIFYHFHYFKFLGKDKVDLGNYKLTKNDISILYKPYVKHLEDISYRLKNIDKENDYNGIIQQRPFHLRSQLKKLERMLKGTYNVYDKKRLKNKDGLFYRFTHI